METTTQQNDLSVNLSKDYVENKPGMELIRIPKDEALKMKDSFRQTTARLFAAKEINFKESYPISIDNLEDMLWVEEPDVDKYDEVRIHFTHYKSEFMPDHPELQNFENSVLLIYSRAKEKKDIEEYFVIYSLNNQLKITKEEYTKITDKFTDIFSTRINDRVIITEKGFTSFVMIPRMELLAYYARIKLYNNIHSENKIRQINICLAEALDKEVLDSIIDEKDKSSDPQELEEAKELKKLRDKDYIPNQLTIVFDAEAEDGNLIENISYYDMNSLCPNQCP
ncbi:hypothetical protein AB4Y90_05850 [Chryseobacterium sp. 2TAF14]|uniref:hypothetical protein n=1 Tax=Chryseobacterium sp. 2TAF14 TaxID=3233007 RepID=UPI003F8E4A39